MTTTFFLDGQEIPFTQGQTVLQAALQAGRYIPHLCWHPEVGPHGSCRLCTVVIAGKPFSSCTQPAMAGQHVACDTPDLQALRRAALQMLFVEGNHYCPSCEKSGACRLQATAYYLGMEDNHFPQQFPRRARDASHPGIILDRDRCIRCERCVRASRLLDGKNVFGVTGRGIRTTLEVNTPSGLLGESALATGDRAMALCPTGALLPKEGAWEVPIGSRRFDRATVAEEDLREYAMSEAGRPEEVHHG